jgi:hypothetical protein
MFETIRALIKEHHAFYEVSPYYVVVDERQGRSPATRRVQAGFDIDVYGAKVDGDAVVMPPPREYALGHAELKRLAEQISRDADESCSLEVIPFSSTAVLAVGGQAKVTARIRIRVSHWRGLDQPAGEPEYRALEEIEKQLRALGVARR